MDGRARCAQRRRPGCADRQLAARQAKGEGGAFALAAGDAHLAAHQFDQTLADDQADAGALGHAGVAAEAVEGGEQFGQLQLAHADAVVLHLEQQHAGRVGADAQLDPAAAAVVLDGVAQQVDQHLAQADRVCLGRFGALALVDAQLDLGRDGHRLDHAQGFSQQLRQGHWLEGQAQLAGLDAREVQHVVDHVGQMPAGLANLGQRAGLGNRVSGAAFGVGQHLGKADDGVQRRAQLVRQARQEVGFGAVGGDRVFALALCLAQAQHVGQVLQRGHGGDRVAAGVAEGAHAGGDLQHPAVAGQVALAPGLVAGQGRRSAVVLGHVGQADVVQRALQQLGLGVAGHGTKGRVGHRDAALHVYQRDADVDAVKDGAKALLAFGQGALGLAPLVDLGAQRQGALGHPVFDPAQPA